LELACHVAVEVSAQSERPLSVSPDTKQELDEIVRLVMLSVPSLFSVIEVERVNACDPSELFVSTAVQVPLMLLEFELLEPHPTSTRPAASNNATASFFIKSVFLFGFYWKWAVRKMPT
jgi:hypothetical protein